MSAIWPLGSAPGVEEHSNDKARTPEPSPRPRYAPPWLFFLLLLPVGLCSGFCLVALPYLLHRSGISVEAAGAILALTLLPQSLRILWIPLLDLGVRRRSVHIVSALCALFALLGAIQAIEKHHIGQLIVVLLIMNVAMTTSDVALGYLCATCVDPTCKERAASFYSAGMICIGGLQGGLILTLQKPSGVLARFLPPLSLGTIGLGLAAPMVILTLVALSLDEPTPLRLPFASHARAVFADAWRSLRAPRAWTGLVICVSPICVGAAANLFGTLANDFHSDAGDVALATGLYSSVGSALGAFVGGRFAAGTGARKAHLLAGVLLSIIPVGMALGPALPQYFVLGCFCYAVASGAAYGTFFSFVFELAQASIGGTTTYGVYVCAANLAIAYVTFLDGRMYAHGGRLGLLLCDAATNLAGVILVIAVHRLARVQPGLDVRQSVT